MGLYDSTGVAITSEAAQFLGLTKGVGDQVFTQQPLTMWLTTSKCRVSTEDGGGEGIAWNCFYGENPNVGVIQGFDTFDTEDYEYATLARLNWKEMVGPVPVSGIEIIKNRAGRTQNFRVQARKLRDTVATMTKKFAQMAYSDGTASTGLNDVRQIDGLGAAVGDLSQLYVTDDKYAGINPNTYAWHIAYVSDSTTIITLDDVLKAKQSCSDYIFTQDWQAFTTAKQWRRLASQLTAQERIMVGPMGQRARDNGFDSFKYMGIEVTYDPTCPTAAGFVSGGAGCLFILNSESVKLCVPPGSEGTVLNEGTAPALSADEDTGKPMVLYNGFEFRPWQNPVNQRSAVATFFWTGNMQNRVRRSTACFRKLSES